ncbi:MAG TPA: RNA-binding protein [Ornithinibacter sp.]|nr:RNA-binding protein [Ornithinibacter sp.]
MDGLTHPRDLEAWHRWQDRSQPVGRRAQRMLGVLRDIARPDGHAGNAVLTRGGPRPRVLVCLESRSGSSARALLEPVRHLDPADVAVIAPVGVTDLLPEGPWTESPGYAPDLVANHAAGGAVVLSTGHFLPLGALGHRFAEPGRFLTVQHGLMTPHAPPLGAGTILLAWSEADAAFWRSGRDDVGSVVVGSQLLWEASEPPPATVDPDAAPVFLGQLHGVELPREVLVEAAETFCRDQHATYRPHPSERDRKSLATHARWEASGITIDRSGIPLRELGAPVVSIFSTGVLEAAAAGLPAWVTLADPPTWLAEFWARYALAPWGGPPTASPERPEVEPSRGVAEVVREMMAG